MHTYKKLVQYLLGALFTLGLLTPAHATLIDNGGGLIYDDVLDVTWSQPDVRRNWNDANTWADGLTLGGATDWRLPYISVAAGAGPFTGSPVDCNTATELACRDNELGYMFYHNLGGTFGSSILTSGDPDLDLFPTLQSNRYWSGTEFDSYRAWGFNFGLGSQSINLQDTNGYSWAVHSGNVGAQVPEPATLWLLGGGLLGLFGVARRKR